MHYHVFLSFRGPDSRKTFTDHLYAALVRKGIVTFRDDEEIEKGEAISKKLREAIRQSRYFIIVLSQEFASSPWCLNELQEIVETKQEQKVFPVFYDVQPGDIGRQRGNVAQAFAKLKGKNSSGKKRRWHQALSKVAEFSG
ncbi:disease resistance protein Roq1-like [Prosopis cineraria]|uniref:disease resistance protein Roq1-like n=1 Tax=Prosopis cineraria TaxID=364024 RepID=UPI002410B1A9|nr:disease resistance protein Roq1-like [Prosopis cineraria]